MGSRLDWGWQERGGEGGRNKGMLCLQKSAAGNGSIAFPYWKCRYVAEKNKVQDFKKN